MMGRLHGSPPARTLLALLILALLAPCLAAAMPQERDDMRGLLPPDELLRPEALMGALISIEIDRQIEADALVVELNAMNRWRSRRDSALNELTTLYGDLDLLFNTAENLDRPEEALLLEDQIRGAESLVQMYGDQGRELRRRIDARRTRMQALAERADELAALMPQDTDSVTGVWDIRFVPTGETGIFTLFQNGTLLTGEYVLDGGWHGSLQGTVVGGKIFLERIDSVKGRFADLTGNLEPDGRAMRGRWNERDLTDGRAIQGSWLGDKRPVGGADR